MLIVKKLLNVLVALLDYIFFASDIESTGTIPKLIHLIDKKIKRTYY